MKLCRLWIVIIVLVPVCILSQSLTVPWSNYARDPQHTAVSKVASLPLTRIRWQAPVDLNPQYSGTALLIHYGSPIVTAANTVIMPVKTGDTDGFRLDVRNGTNGSLKYSLSTDYSLPPHNWIPSYGPALTVRNRLYWAGAGGTVYYRDQPDSVTGPSGQIAFFGNATYSANPSAFNSTVKISTPIIGDRYGNIFFGFIVLGSNPAGLISGLAKIDYRGTGTYITATAAAGGDTSINRVAMNGTPTLSNDHRTLYFVVSTASWGSGYLVSINSLTLDPVARIRLTDPKSGSNAIVPDDGTATPMVGPDGDVYYGVLENPFPSNHDRGWLLHFNGALTQTKTPGAFGWDDTPSVVPSKLVPSYTGTSPYLVLTKFNNYAGANGDGVNKIAILDPNVLALDPISGIPTMKEVLTIAGPTPDSEFRPNFPNAVREWCINSAVVDPFTKSALVNNEDGILYRWDFTTNTLSQSVVLTAGIGEAYTPTLVGVDGTVYAINNAILFAVGP
jgi:hypothetical protein